MKKRSFTQLDGLSASNEEAGECECDDMTGASATFRAVDGFSTGGKWIPRLDAGLNAWKMGFRAWKTGIPRGIPTFFSI